MLSGITFASWGIPVTWVLTIAGWIIVDRRSRRNSSASEVFQMINDLENLLNDFCYNVTDSLLLDGDCPEANRLRRQAIRMTTVIQRKLKTLRQRSENFDFNSQYLALKKLATGEDFESTNRPALLSEDSRLDEIETKTSDLIQKIHGSYNRIYNRSVSR